MSLKRNHFLVQMTFIIGSYIIFGCNWVKMFNPASAVSSTPAYPSDSDSPAVAINTPSKMETTNVTSDFQKTDTPTVSTNTFMSEFPAEIYPSPLPPSQGWWQQCANPFNIEETKEPSLETVLKVLNILIGSANLDEKRRVADPAIWEDLAMERRTEKLNPDPTSTVRPTREIHLDEDSIETVLPARESPYGELLSNLCGEKVVNKSWWVKVCPVGPCRLTSAEALKVDFYLIKRGGQWLIWAIFP